MASPETDTGRPLPAAALLFDNGKRPEVEAIRAMAAGSGFTVSFDPAAGAGGVGEAGRWVEILSSGLTFDLTGLAPGQPATPPPRAHTFGLAEEGALELLEAVALQPGPHLAGGASVVPVVRQLAWVSAQLAAMPGVRAVAWPAARVWSGPRHFRDVVLRWSEGGVFPGFGLAALAPMPDGGMQSEGMALFTGQELRLEPELARDRAAGAKLGVRLLHWLFEHGPVVEATSITAPDGRPLRIAPSTNARFVRVWAA